MLPADNPGGSGRVDLGGFYEAHGRDLRRAFRRRAKTYRLDLEDIVQEVMARAGEQVLANPDEFDSYDALLAWCVVVGWNHMTDLAKRAHRRREEPHPSPGTIGSLVDRVDFAGQLAESDELAREMAKLLPQYAQVLRMDADGHSREDIAKTFGISVDAATQLLYRARKAARKGWGLVVTSVVLLGDLVRRTVRSAAGAQSALVITVVSVSMVISVFPLPNVLVPLSPGAAVVSTPLRQVAVAKPTAPAPAATKTMRRLPGKTGLTQNASGGKGEAATVPVPKTKACTPQGCVGVGACPDKKQAGDRIYVKPLGDPCAYYYTENTTPVCEHVSADNPVIGCHRDGDPQWTVKPPPVSPVPEGAPR